MNSNPVFDQSIHDESSSKATTILKTDDSVASITESSTEGQSYTTHMKDQDIQYPLLSTTTTLKIDGSIAAVAGSTIEGQSYAKQMADHVIQDSSASTTTMMKTTVNSNTIIGRTDEQPSKAKPIMVGHTQDIDVMIVEGSVDLPDALIPTLTPGFVQIRYDRIKILNDADLKKKSNQNGVVCVNGFEMKKRHCKKNTSPAMSHISFTGHTKAESASVAGTTSYQIIGLDKQFQRQLANISNITDQHKQKYRLFCEGFLTSLRQYVFPLLNNIHTSNQMSEWNLNEDYFRDVLSLIGPAYGYYLPQVNKVRMIEILNFYEKYKMVGNAQHMTDQCEYLQDCLPTESDIVPCFQLKFWPKDVEPFLNRIKSKCPQLFNLISNSGISMHVIPKWSTKTPEVDKEIEFRYSFSYIERLLAENRTEKEQILNGVARSLYYRYLKGKCRLPSYFIKTTVLWMCELMNIENFKETNEIAQQWLKFASERLKEKVCSHYFIENLNIFEPYPAESLSEAYRILISDVQLDTPVQLQILNEQEQRIRKYNQNDQNFVCQLKVKDVLNAIEDYRLLRAKWLDIEQTHSSLTESDAEGCLNVLNILCFIDGKTYQNWAEFRRIFLDEESIRCIEQPLWGESVSKCSPSEFAHSIMLVGYFLKAINEAISDPKFNGQCQGCNPHDFLSYQNVAQDLTNPANMMNRLISMWGPLFGANAEMLSSFISRTPLANHPQGPQLNLDQAASITTENALSKFSKQMSNNLVSLLQSVPDRNMTLGDLIVHHQSHENHSEQHSDLAETEEQLMAYALQLSLDLQQEGQEKISSDESA